VAENSVSTMKNTGRFDLACRPEHGNNLLARFWQTSGTHEHFIRLRMDREAGLYRSKDAAIIGSMVRDMDCLPRGRAANRIAFAQQPRRII